MSKALTLSQDLSLPLEAVTSTFGLLAIRGAGKSTAAAVMVEQMYAAGLAFVVIDTEGSWYGLRADRSGRPGGIKVPIFGGQHGDIPLEVTSGKLIANLIASKNLSCVLDLELLSSDGERQRFLLDFANELLIRNRNPIHVFCEEADVYLQQNPDPRNRPLVGAWLNLIQRGRKRGIGVTLITQRSALVSKTALNMCETLFVLRTTGPRDIKSIKDWVQYNQVDETLVSSLPSLENGEAWVWSPHFLGVMKRFRFNQRTTFDSGATPSVRSKRQAATLADIDLGSIREKMAATIERVNADDPKMLRKRIAELERSLALKPKAKPVEVEVVPPELLREIEEQSKNLVEHLTHIEQRLANLNLFAKKVGSKTARRLFTPTTSHKEPTQRAQMTNGKLPKEEGPATQDLDRQTVSKCERAILSVLAQHGRLTLTQATIIARYSTTSSGPVNAASRLRTLGYIKGFNIDGVEITEKGRAILGDFDPLPTGRALAEFWYRELGKCEAAILRVVVDAYPKPVSLNDAASLSNPPYSLESSGPVNAASKLRTLCLVNGKNTGMIANERLIS